jgi:hypothetical protein
MKRMLVIGVACLSLLVAAPVASALPPQAPSMQTVTCSVATAGGTYSWSFRLPSYATAWFQQALARAQQQFPSLNCTLG